MSFLDQVLAARRSNLGLLSPKPLAMYGTPPINPNPNVSTIDDGGYGANTTNPLLPISNVKPPTRIGLMGESILDAVSRARKALTTPEGFEEAGERAVESTDMYNLYKFPETIQNDAKNWDTSVVDNRAIRKIVSEDPIIGAIIQAESSGGRNLNSPKGARGVMQLMPNTYGRTLNKEESKKESIKQGKEVKVYNYARGMYGKFLDDTQVMDAELNVKFGAEYYNKLKQDKDIGNNSDRQALIAYNWGPGNYKKWKAGGTYTINNKTVTYTGGKEAELPKETRNYLERIEESMGGQLQ